MTKREMITAGTPYRIESHGRFFALHDTRSESLIGIFVYLRGVGEVVRLLMGGNHETNS